MTAEVRKKIYVMDILVNREITIAKASEALGLGVRLSIWLKKEMTRRGIKALGHGNMGRKPKQELNPPTETKIIETAQTDLKDANCTHITKLIAEHSAITVMFATFLVDTSHTTISTRVESRATSLL